MTISYAVGQRFTATMMQTLADYTVNRPLVKLVTQSSQALADATEVAIQYGVGSTVFDTHTYHSETVNTTRITPLIPGYYKATVIGFFDILTTPVAFYTVARLNGATLISPSTRLGAASVGLAASGVPNIGEVAMNGTTDYVEHLMWQDSAGADSTIVPSGSFRCGFALEFLRPT